MDSDTTTASPPEPETEQRPATVPTTPIPRFGGMHAPRGSLLTPGLSSSRMPPGLQAKMAALASRNAANSSQNSVDAATLALRRTGISDSAIRPAPSPPSSTGVVGRRKGPGLKLSDMAHGGGAQGAGLGAGRPNLGAPTAARRPPPGQLGGTPFSNFGKIVDPSGALNFAGKATVHGGGVRFDTGTSFSINMSEFELREELGKGTYGTVKKVLHKPTNVLMAMKEIRVELDQSKLNAIIMELDILHRASAPEIIEFYGAFFVESCVYYCMEFMDAGSLDKLKTANLPEDVLARITHGVVRGLKFLKDSLQIIHRDVKPTNMLVNGRGEIKLCDFGVSGQLEKSLAKTNIGCQSYMAPERIHGESQNNIGTYTVSSDIWSLGLSIIEITLGHYPYPPETYANVFAQLTAIVHGDPPELSETYSSTAHEFVAMCLRKVADQRPTYAELLEHPWLVEDSSHEVDMAGWVAQAKIDSKELRAAPSPERASAPPP